MPTAEISRGMCKESLKSTKGKQNNRSDPIFLLDIKKKIKRWYRRLHQRRKSINTMCSETLVCLNVKVINSNL
ncbi:hypothetical protein BATDEDRAFT_85977 [Batrachochytrium dendrobatidis JAM81]|uniref:Uncharacterized protein n=1 Tax=Batrachochytrium dendrobatidis (strain JAM81 / FGSC 10211) TaxID=684364 RepID=F4NTU7_BATDJ|nr:uncharacterized protein BATDEDRAFT_85977 [Batrachochytrium dendrobatidis JAM81]EGF83541.1 hypothetical protein BATDEDRAFT_85977 [Batrachochytrium dendrobatidis JAM81]|eukprot:XP_006676133.1 hypothetical protein BATDEDRAFT_85977 [Batrachochytrium dendrobatidis JAM81]